MAWRKYVSGLTFGVVAFGAALVFVVFTISPEKGYLAISAFFLNLFLFLVCLFTIIGFYSRRRIANNEVLFLNLKAAFRQGTMLVLYFSLLAIMKAAEILNVLNAMALAVAVLFLDMFFKEKV